MAKIARDIGRSLTYVQTRAKQYGIKTILPHERNHKQILDADELAFLAGSLLGDGSLEKSGPSNSSCLYALKQSIIHSSYLNWAATKMAAWASNKSEPIRHQYWLEKETGRPRHSIRFRSICHPEFGEIQRGFYINGFKRPDRNFLEQHFSIFSLAVLIMEDGGRAARNKRTKISTEGFLGEDTIWLKELLKRRFGLDSYLIKRKVKTAADQRYEIEFTTESSASLAKLIRGFVIPDMRYKLVSDPHTPINSDPSKVTKAI